ncbi:MAG: arginine--tRNA ligase, partial [Bacteroidales bacterium]|nr:arginine--tRNA ligase [Bacteroidales bacterium]
MLIEEIISKAVAEALKALYGVEVEASSITPSATKKEFEGNLTIVVFPFLKASKKAPEVTATEIGEYIKDNCVYVHSFNVVKGFLNITIEPNFWTQVLCQIADDADYGFKKADDNSPLVMIEYSSPNTNK